MTRRRGIESRETGMIRIYLKSSDKTARGTRAFWSGRPPLYRDLELFQND